MQENHAVHLISKVGSIADISDLEQKQPELLYLFLYYICICMKKPTEFVECFSMYS